MSALAARLAVTMETARAWCIIIVMTAYARTLTSILKICQWLEETAQAKTPIKAKIKHHILCDCRKCNPSSIEYMQDLAKAFED